MKTIAVCLIVAIIGHSSAVTAKRDKPKNKAEPQASATPASPDETAFKTTAAEIQTGVRMVQAENMAMGRGMGFPQKLDKQADGPCVTCFTAVTGDGLNDPRWVKSGNTYRFTGAGFSGEFIYDPASGTVKVMP